jgi:hypothetical protein
MRGDEKVKDISMFLLKILFLDEILAYSIPPGPGNGLGKNRFLWFEFFYWAHLVWSKTS